MQQDFLVQLLVLLNLLSSPFPAVYALSHYTCQAAIPNALILGGLFVCLFVCLVCTFHYVGTVGLVIMFTPGPSSKGWGFKAQSRYPNCYTVRLSF